jgi:hypothetical protein
MGRVFATKVRDVAAEAVAARNRANSENVANLDRIARENPDVSGDVSTLKNALAGARRDEKA